MGTFSADPTGVAQMPVYKDPLATMLVGVDWTDLLQNYPDASRTIVSSDWDLTDSGITVANDDVVTGALKTTCTLSGGTAGRAYTVRNRVTSNGTPAVTEVRSFVVRVEDR